MKFMLRYANREPTLEILLMNIVIIGLWIGEVIRMGATTLGQAVRSFAERCELAGEPYKDKGYWNVPVSFEGKSIILTVTISGDKEPSVIDGVSAAWALAYRYRTYDYNQHSIKWMGDQKYADNHYKGDSMSDAIWERMQTVGKSAVEVFGDAFGVKL